MEGSNQVLLSPDEKYFGFLHSDSNHPWELYIQENNPGKKPIQITDKAMSPEFKAYPWRKPEIITFDAADHTKVYARIYKPEKKMANHAAVLFVHVQVIFKMHINGGPAIFGNTCLIIC
jgi:dipeptidyl aminopeptidase/acylaminoacyl peptidase